MPADGHARWRVRAVAPIVTDDESSFLLAIPQRAARGTKHGGAMRHRTPLPSPADYRP
jgi:hypothetical protein